MHWFTAIRTRHKTLLNFAYGDGSAMSVPKTADWGRLANKPGSYGETIGYLVEAQADSFTYGKGGIADKVFSIADMSGR